MKVYTAKEAHKMIRKDGWTIKSSNGSHIKYEKDGRTMVVPKTYVNRMVLQRLVKENNLGIKF